MQDRPGRNPFARTHRAPVRGLAGLVLALGMSVGPVLAAGDLPNGAQADDEREKGSPSSSAAGAPSAGTPSPAAPVATPAAFARAAASAVSVVVRLDAKHLRYGSGVIVARRNGVATIVTARHVVDTGFDGSAGSAASPGRPVTVRFAGGPAVAATVQWMAPHGVDLALLSAPIDSADARAAEFAAKVDLHAGDALFTLLQPLPPADDSAEARPAPANSPAGDATPARGAVMAMRDVQQDDYAFRQLQSDLPIRSGDSGGGIFDEGGRLVAIHAMRALTRPGSSAVSFATPADVLLELAPPGFAKFDPADAAPVHVDVPISASPALSPSASPLPAR